MRIFCHAPQVLQETDIIAEGRIRPRTTAPAKPAKAADGAAAAEDAAAEAPADQSQAPTQEAATAAEGDKPAEVVVEAPAVEAAPAGELAAEFLSSAWSIRSMHARLLSASPPG